jgi:hypothetical protein
MNSAIKTTLKAVEYTSQAVFPYNIHGKSTFLGKITPMNHMYAH